MIQITIDTCRLEYDIYSLVKSFTKEQDIKIQFVPFTVEDYTLCEPGEIKLALTTEFASFCFGGITFPEKITFDTKQQDGEVFLVSCKNEFRKYFYRACTFAYQQELPWGNLTGIRPTKIASDLLKKGYQEADVFAYFIKEHYTSHEKAELAVAIAQREKAL